MAGNNLIDDDNMLLILVNCIIMYNIIKMSLYCHGVYSCERTMQKTTANSCEDTVRVTKVTQKGKKYQSRFLLNGMIHLYPGWLWIGTPVLRPLPKFSTTPLFQQKMSQTATFF